jgi:hypothetical protein
VPLHFGNMQGFLCLCSVFFCFCFCFYRSSQLSVCLESQKRL